MPEDLNLGERVGETDLATPDAAPPAHDGDCHCHDDEPAYPELDARAIPHAIRHGAVLGALSQLRPGKALVLVAPHDPLPLLAQVERTYPETFEVSYRERGPEAWRLQLTRVG